MVSYFISDTTNYLFIFDNGSSEWYIDTGKRKIKFHGNLIDLELKYGTLFECPLER